MPLTPEDVSNKRFTPVRLREGYDMGEVDQFLDEVETELARLIKDNDDLREQLRVARDNPSAVAAAPVETEAAPESDVTPATDTEDAAQSEATADPDAVAEPETATEPETVTEPVEADAVTEPTATAVDQPAAVRRIHVTTSAEASTAATRLLEMATNNADQLVAAAQVDADQILSDARTQAEQLESESKASADKVEAEARSRAQMLDSETVERRAAVVGELEKEKGRLNTEVENLRAFEREYRSRLKSYFTQQLSALENDSDVDAEEGGSADQPKRLRSLLGEE